MVMWCLMGVDVVHVVHGRALRAVHVVVRVVRLGWMGSAGLPSLKWGGRGKGGGRRICEI